MEEAGEDLSLGLTPRRLFVFPHTPSTMKGKYPAMVPENAFTAKEEKDLAAMRLSFEMAVAAEWVVRDEDRPDHLLSVYVTTASLFSNELQAACSCPAGTIDRPCAHALGVIRRIREQDHILVEILKQGTQSVLGLNRSNAESR